MAPTIAFLHANGFPSASYGKLFRLLQPDYPILPFPMLGHDPRYPIMPHWRNQVEEYAAFLRREALAPVIGLGHSLGAMVTFKTAWHYPELFQSIILLDPPLINGPVSMIYGAAKWLGQIDRVTPAGQTQGRRSHWRDQAEALSYFRSKRLYANFDPECLEDYLRSGLRAKQDGLHLAFDPDVEVAFFRQTPYDSWRYRRRLGVPGAVIYGRQSQVAQAAAIGRLARRHQLYALTVEGGHMFPLERPEMAAGAVLQALRTLQGERRET